MQKLRQGSKFFYRGVILLVHIIFGAALGYLASNIYLAVVLSLAGHYFLDMIPHIEYLESNERSIGKIKNGQLKGFLRDALFIFLDIAIGFLLILLLSKNSLAIYAGAVATLAPDAVTFFNCLFPSKLLSKHDRFHEIIHFLERKKISKFWRVSSQVIVAIISATILLS